MFVVTGIRAAVAVLVVTAFAVIAAASSFTPSGVSTTDLRASKALVLSGGYIFAASCSDGVVMTAVPSKIHQIDSSSSHRWLEKQRKFLYKIDDIVVGVSGIQGDSKRVLEKIRKFMADFRSTYGFRVPLSILADSISRQLHKRSVSPDLRSLAVNVIMAEHDTQTGSNIVHIRSAGDYANYNFASSIPQSLWEASIDQGNNGIADLTRRESAEKQNKPDSYGNTLFPDLEADTLDSSSNIVLEEYREEAKLFSKLNEVRWSERRAEEAISLIEKLILEYYEATDQVGDEPEMHSPLKAEIAILQDTEINMKIR
jgi:20S proteasome alpha/beta subunit